MWWTKAQKNIYLLGKIKTSSHGESMATVKNSSCASIASLFLDIINIYLKMRFSIIAALNKRGDMNKEILKLKTVDEKYNFIRLRLSSKEYAKERRRFDMSGYDNKTGSCTVSNINILNEFADLGIYDYTHYLFLDFHKGTGTIYCLYWGDSSEKNIRRDVSGLGTTDIIYEIFQLTIFSGKDERRRN